MRRKTREYMNVSAKVHPETVARMNDCKHFLESTTNFIEAAILREVVRRKEEGKQ